MPGLYDYRCDHIQNPELTMARDNVYLDLVMVSAYLY